MRFFDLNFAFKVAAQMMLSARVRMSFIAIISVLGARQVAAAESSMPVVFFDLGDTVIDSHDRQNLKYYPSSKRVIDEARQAGLKTGLIVNIPATFGLTCQDKFQKLKDTIANSWQQGTQGFQWNDFNYVYLPPSDPLRKPHPYLFVGAMSKACPSSMVYFGEDQGEITAAERLGIASHWVGTSGEPVYPSLETILNMRSTMPDGCQFASIWNQVGIPAGFDGCLFEP